MGIGIYTSAIYGVDVSYDTEDLKRRICEIIGKEYIEDDYICLDDYLWELHQFNYNVKSLTIDRTQEETSEYYRNVEKLRKIIHLEAVQYGSSDDSGYLIGINCKSLGELNGPVAFDLDELHPTDDDLRFLMNSLHNLGITDVEPKLFISNYYSY